MGYFFERRKQHDLHPSPDRQSQCGGSGKISPGTGDKVE